MTEKKSVLEITDEEAQKVTGGTGDECREIYEFIRTHDPALFAKAEEFTTLINSDPLYGAQVMIEKALGFRVVLVAPTQLPNVYRETDGGRRYTHTEVMQMLKEKYGE